MAADYIVVTKSNRPQLGSQLVALANKWIEIRQLATALKQIKDHQNAAGDFTVMAGQFGLSAGDAASAAGILDNVNTLWNTNTDVLGATGAIDTTGADLIVGAASTFGDTVTTFIDSKGNTWHRVATGADNSGQTTVQFFWTAATSVGSGHSFEADSATHFPAVAVAAFSGYSAFDQAGGASSAVQPGSMTPAEDGELVLTAIGWFPSGTLSVNGGFTISDQQDFNPSFSIGCALAYLIQTTATPSNPTWSESGGFGGSAVAQVMFKGTGASPPPPATYTGTAALASAATTLAATATFVAPTYHGVTTLTSGATVLAASASFTTPVYSAAATLTSAATTLSSAATFTAPEYTGAATLTSQPTTLAATAHVTNPTYSGAAGWTSAATTFGASALFATAVYSGSAALTSGVTTLTASATFSAPVYSGTAALGSGSSLFSAVGSFAGVTYSGAAALTTRATVLSASATFTPGTHTATAAWVAGPGLLAAVATFTPDPSSLLGVGGSAVAGAVYCAGAAAGVLYSHGAARGVVR